MQQRTDGRTLRPGPVKVSLFLTIAVLAASPAVLSKPDKLAQVPETGVTLKGRVERDVAMADQLMLKGKWADAADLYKQAANRNPKNVPVLLGLGMALAKQFKLDGAGEQFDKVLAIDPDNPVALSGKATVWLHRLQSSSATILRNRDNILKQAEEACRKALGVDPALADAHLTLGLVYKDQGRLEEATSELQEALKLDPKSGEALVALGMLKMTKGELDAAQEDFKQAIVLNSGNSTAHYGLGRIHLKQGRTDDAIHELNTSLYQFPNSSPVREALGAAYELQGNTVAAIKEYQESIRIKPENPLGYVRIAQIRQKRGDIEHSIAELRSGLELMPDNPELHMWVANQSMQLGRFDEAVKSYAAVLSLDGQRAEAAKGLARAYSMKARQQTAAAFVSSNEFEKAEQMIAQALQLTPDDYELRLAQAKINMLAGKAVDLKAMGTPKTDGERVAYAEALLAQNNFGESANQMNKVIASAIEPSQILAVADLALMIKDLSSAEAAYKKALAAGGFEEHARRGLAGIATARTNSKQHLHLAADLSRRKQYRSSIDKYRAAISDDPRSADARLGLAKAIEKTGQSSDRQLKEAAREYRAYVALETNLPATEATKLRKRIDRLENRATKLAIEQQKRIQK